MRILDLAFRAVVMVAVVAVAFVFWFPTLLVGAAVLGIKLGRRDAERFQGDWL